MDWITHLLVLWITAGGALDTVGGPAPEQMHAAAFYESEEACHEALAEAVIASAGPLHGVWGVDGVCLNLEPALTNEGGISTATAIAESALADTIWENIILGPTSLGLCYVDGPCEGRCFPPDLWTQEQAQQCEPGSFVDSDAR